MIKLNGRVLVENISGIGPVHSSELSLLGYINAIDLLAVPEIQLINTLSEINGLSDFSLEQSILPQARMLRLPGCTEAIASALVDAAYHRYSDFLSVSVSKIQTIISKVTGEEKNAQNLIVAYEILLAAVQLAVTSSARIVVYDSETKLVIPGAVVSIDGDRRTKSFDYITHSTDDRGIVDFEGIASLPTMFKINAPGYIQHSFLTTLKTLKHDEYRVHLIAGTDDLASLNEFMGGFAVGYPDLISVRKTVELDTLPKTPPICIETITNNEAIVGSLWFVQTNESVIIYRMRIDLNTLPNEIAPGNVLLPEENGWRLHPDGITPAAYREVLRHERSPIQTGEGV